MVLQCGKDLKRLSWLKYRRTEKEETTIEHRYYIKRSENKAESLLNESREHWGIETSYDFRLDIAFREDESRIREGNGAENASHFKTHCFKFDFLKKILPNSAFRLNGSKLGGMLHILKKCWLSGNLRDRSL